MRIEDVTYAVKNMLHRKTRSYLTVLSVTLGIMTIFALMSFGYGIDDYMHTLADKAGADKIYIQAKGIGAPGSDTTFSLTKEDIDFVSKINGVKEIAPYYIKVAEVLFKKEKKYNYVGGFDPDFAKFIEETMTISIVKGRGLKKGDDNKAVLGYNYQFDQKIFKKGVKLSDKITVNNQIYEIIGFYAEVGNPSDDANIYLTNTAMESLFPSLKDKYAMALLRADKTENPEQLAEKITEKLRKYKGQDKGKENFFVMTFTEVLKTFGSIISIINSVLVLIGLISILVALVNIMNTMYTAVYERTKEIGVMKAIGAKNNDILAVFVIESSLLGLIGSLTGIILGYLISKFGEAAAAAGGYSLLKPVFPPSLIIGCILFGIIVGAAAGLFPAIQASKLKPVEALRYE